MNISLKSIKITWFITVMALYIIGFIQKYKTGGGNVFLTLATSSVVLSMLINQYYLSKANGSRSFMRFIGLVVILTAIILLIVWMLSR